MSEYKDLLPLVIDPDTQSKALLRKLLAAFGVSRIMTAQATDDALMMMRREKFDLVFLDEMAGPLKALHFLKMLRRDLHASDVAVPVILVCAKIDAAKVTQARDAGMNDVISKPVNLPAIERQLRAALAPRPFVSAKSFVGPDRRHQREDRRNFGERPLRFDRRAKKKPGAPGAPDSKKPS